MVLPDTPPMAWKLPADLLREIIARSDHGTLLRFAATCKLLRCDILSPPLDPRVIHAAPCILAYLCPDAKNPLAVAHPTTHAALSFCLPRSLSRKAAKTLCKYTPVASRRGLLVLRRRNIDNPPKSHGDFDTCVYDPMSGAQSFFSDPHPPETSSGCDRKYVLLTAADGIVTNSFLLLAIDFQGLNMTIHTASSRGTWRSVTVTYERKSYEHEEYVPLWWTLKKLGDPAILSGGVIHWLQESDDDPDPIISYDLGTGKMGTVELPSIDCEDGNQHCLVTSTDGKLLKLLAIQGFKMFVWIQLPVSAAGGSGWSLETVIDMEENLRSLDPHINCTPSGHERIEFEGSGKRTGEVVFLRVRVGGYAYTDGLIVFDLETKKMYRQKRGLALLEIDLPSRLQTMKIYFPS